MTSSTARRIAYTTAIATIAALRKLDRILRVIQVCRLSLFMSVKHILSSNYYVNIKIGAPKLGAC